MAENTETSTVALRPEEEAHLDEIRRRGAYEVARRDVVRQVYKQLEGCEWGSGNSIVRGTDLSPAARASLAHFCVTVGAHPQLHVVLLGGKPWLNTEFWSDRLNTEDHFVDFVQHNISKDPEKREDYGVPEWATHAYETVIRKLVPFAPIEKIRSGEITDWQQYVVEVREANWAGNRPLAKSKKGYEYEPDPVGNAEPAKTARTRSLRRAAVRAFPAWMEQFQQHVKRHEEILEADWEIVREDQKALAASLPAPNGAQAARTGSGEPTAANAAGAREIPVVEEKLVDQDKAAAVELKRQQEKFKIGCQVIGAQPEAVIADVLEGREPETVDDWTALANHVQRLADEAAAEDEGDAEQRSLV